MSTNTGHMSVTEFAEDGAVVRVTVHKLDEYESKRLIEEFKAFVGNGDKRRIVLDFTEVEFVSSAGLGAMITMSRTVDEHDGKMILTGINENVLSVMKLTRLDRMLTIEKDLAKAQKAALK